MLLHCSFLHWRGTYFSFFWGTLLASWLLGFLASWLFGFSAFRILSFLAFWLVGFLAFRLLVGLCGFWWLLALAFRIRCISGRWRFGFCRFLLVYATFGGFGFSHLLLSQFLSGLWLLHPFISFWLWLPASSALPVPPYLNHFFEHHGGASPPR